MRDRSPGSSVAEEPAGEARARGEGVGGSPLFPVLRPPFPPVDLYRSRLLGPLLRSPVPQRLLQGALLAGYVALVWLGWGQDAIPGVPELHPRMYTHASTLLFWVLWFMGLVFLVPLVGRGWCGLCPLGLVSDVLGRRGLGLGWPRWVRSGAGTVALFAAGVAAVAWADVHMSPHRTALVVGGVGVLAALVSALFRRSAFCRGLCPVGSVLHLYGRHAPVEVRTRDPALCRACQDHSCTDTRKEWRRWDLGNWVFQRKVHRSGCPVALYPPDMDPGACLLCLRCVRSCSRSNLGAFWGRKPQGRSLDAARTALLVLILGTVGLALLRTWPDAWALLTPGIGTPTWVAALWLGLALPALVLVGPHLAGRAWSGVAGTPAQAPGAAADPGRAAGSAAARGQTALARFAPAFVGLALGGHAALALVKLNAKVAYLPYLAYDPSGAATYLAIHVSRILPVPDLLLPLPALRWAALVLLGLGAAGGVREGWRAWRGGEPGIARWLYALGFAAWTGVLGAALVHWLFPR